MAKAKKIVVVEDTFRPSLDDDDDHMHRQNGMNGIDPISRARADLDSCWIAGFLHHEEIEREREVRIDMWVLVHGLIQMDDSGGRV